MISFIIPLYNIPNNYLERCLKSFFSQKSIDQCEVIVVNDASELEENDKLCTKYKKYKNFKYVKLNNNSGVSTARFVGLSHAEKEFCCFFDADDFVNPNSLDILLETINKEGKNFDIWKSIERFVNGDTLEIELKFTNSIKEFHSSSLNLTVKFYENSMIGGKLLKTNIARDVSMFAQKIQNHEDLFFILCYLMKINYKRMGKIDYEIFSICNRSNSASNNPNVYQKCTSFLWFLDMLYLYKQTLDDTYLKNKKSKKLTFEFSKIIDLFFWDIVRLYAWHYDTEKHKINKFYKMIMHKLKKDFGIKKIPREQKEINKIKKKYRQKKYFWPINFVKKIIKYIFRKNKN